MFAGAGRDDDVVVVDYYCYYYYYSYSSSSSYYYYDDDDDVIDVLWLMLSNASGIATSLLYSVFEAWMTAEHNR